MPITQNAIADPNRQLKNDSDSDPDIKIVIVIRIGIQVISRKKLEPKLCKWAKSIDHGNKNKSYHDMHTIACQLGFTKKNWDRVLVIFDVFILRMQL